MSERALKPGWRTWRFDQIAVNATDRVDDPSKAGVDYYVGLEHLDSNSLKIRRWGAPTDVEATKLRFRQGDIIFGRRRAYQRKLAVADFNGICSAHAMVLRARPDVVLPEFLPFFMQSDHFMARAEQISVGSLSPTINWKALAVEKFTLPPIDEQRTIANALSSVESILMGLQDAEAAAQAMRSSVLAERLSSLSRNLRVMPVQLGDVVDSAQYGLSTAPQSNGKYVMLRMMNFEDGRAVENDICYVELSDEDFRRYELHRGDVLFNRTNSFELVGRTGMYDLPGRHVFASYLVRIRPDRARLLPEFLTEFLNSPLGVRQIRAFATRGVSQSNVNATNLRRVQIPLPAVADQEILLSELKLVRDAAAVCQGRLAEAETLKRQFVASLTDGA
jgi:restriction endonuclease S subunit